MNDQLRHPGVDSALTLGDIAPGQRYVTYIPNQEVIERGIFTSAPEYEGETDRRWVAEAEVVSGKVVVAKTVLLFSAGVTPSEEGDRWSECVTIADDTDYAD
jgi:hypothetical protein